MTRLSFAKTMRRILHLHYRVQTDGIQCMYDAKTHLLLPNHPAFIDPLILFSECAEVPLRPMVDERFFRNPIYRRVLALGDAILVPDLEKSHHRVQDALQARQLTDIVLSSLSQGKEIAFYPSGHVKLIDKEVIGNRRLAYEVCQQLPDNVEVVLVRTRGLEQSHWSKLKPKNFKLRRTVTMHFQVMTQDVKEWAKLDKRAFNAQLENWYNTTD